MNKKKEKRSNILQIFILLICLFIFLYIYILFTQSELLALIPSSGASSISPQTADVVAQLRRLLADLETLKSQRLSFEKDMKTLASKDNICKGDVLFFS